MGMMTTIGLLNDYLHDIEKDPEGFIRELTDSIQSGKLYTTRIGQATILPSHHADVGQLVYAQGNLYTSFRYAPFIHDDGKFQFPMDLSRIAIRERRRRESLRILRDSRKDIVRLLGTLFYNEGISGDELEKRIARIMR